MGAEAEERQHRHCVTIVFQTLQVSLANMLDLVSKTGARGLITGIRLVCVESCKRSTDLVTFHPIKAHLLSFDQQPIA